ncbi:MAG: DMT family transporter [Ardenticatenaceae bacterium]|nr:DMT family transporter [Ardenticatenaceae bacterium]
MQPKAFPYIILLSLFWGTNIVASRFGIGEFDPYLFIALRLATATLFFIPIAFANGRRWPQDRTIWKHGIISGILGVAIPMTSFILSLQYQSSGVASIFVTASPAIIVIMAHFVLPDEKMTRNKAIGLVLALLGALFLVLRGESGLADVGRASPLGFILVMMGLVSEAINTMYVRRRMMHIDPMTVTGIRLFTGAVIAFVAALLVGEFTLADVTPAGYFSLAYAGLIGALAGQFTAFYIQRRFGATAFSLTSYIIPVVATTFGVLLLDEIVTWAMLVGIVLIGSGIYLISKRTAVTVRRMPLR